MNPIRQYNRNPLIEGSNQIEVPVKPVCPTAPGGNRNPQLQYPGTTSLKSQPNPRVLSGGLVLVAEHLLHRRWREDRYSIQATLIQKHATEAMKIQCC